MKKMYKCRVRACKHISDTPYDHGAHANEVHSKYSEPKIIGGVQKTAPSTTFVCGKKGKT